MYNVLKKWYHSFIFSESKIKNIKLLKSKENVSNLLCKFVEGIFQTLTKYKHEYLLIFFKDNASVDRIFESIAIYMNE